MSEWYQRQFGDRGVFAISVSLGVEPHGRGSKSGWGSLEIWARGRCLTASHAEGSHSTGVRWSLVPVLRWLSEVGIRLVNEDPYPRFSRGRDVRDGVSWYDATMSPPVLSPDAEDRWFSRRSEWRHHHALRRAAEDVALPNIVFKRMAEQIEVSWDNDAWPPPRPDLVFVEKRGRELVPALTFGSVIHEALTEVSSTLAARTLDSEIAALAREAHARAATAEDWRWLIHRPTAVLIRREMPALAGDLDRATERSLSGLYAPHSPPTLILRQARLETVAEVQALLNAAVLHGPPIAPALQSLVRAKPANPSRPWQEGNDFAQLVRESLGWGDDPLPELNTWMTNQGVTIPHEDFGLPSSVALLAGRSEAAQATAHVNPRARRARRETGLATALGHILLDDSPVAVDGDWEHWPTAARARAFGVALTLPEQGVREFLNGVVSIGEPEVRGLMNRYRAGTWATTFRLRNLGLISDDEQVELTQSLS